MDRSKYFFVFILLIGLAVTGFQCASTEMTSAKLYIQQKNYTKAIESLKKEVTKNPNSDEGYYLLGYVNGELGNYDDMMDAYNKSLGISSQFKANIMDSRKYFWAQLFNQGVGYFQKANNNKDKDSAKVLFDKSIFAFNTAIKLEPDSADTYKNLAFVYMTQEKYDDAIKPLQTLLGKQKTLDGYKYLGEIYYDKATKLKTEYDNTHNAQDSVQSMDYFNKTIDLMQEGRKTFPSNSELLLLLSNSYIGAHKIEVAIDAFKEGVEREPNNKYYRYNYGVLLLGAKDYKTAEEEFKKAIEIDPEYQNAIYNLAVTYVKWGADLNKVNENKSTDAPADTAYIAKYRAAVPYLEKAVEMKSNDASMWELLGRVYTVLGNQDKATEAFNKADQLRK